MTEDERAELRGLVTELYRALLQYAGAIPGEQDVRWEVRDRFALRVDRALGTTCWSNRLAEAPPKESL